MPNNLVFESIQRSNEYASGQYYGPIDILRQSEKQTESTQSLQLSITNHYRKTSPKLFAAFDAFREDLERTANASQELVSLSKQSLGVLESIEGDLSNIHHSLEHGFELLALRLDETNSLLSEIRDILSRPVATQASEFLERGIDFLKDGFYEEAEHDLVNVVELDPANYVSWYLIAIARSEGLGNYEGAMEALDRCDRYASVRSTKHHSKSLLQRSLLLHSVEGDLRGAINAAEDAVTANDKNIQAEYLLSKLYAEAGDIDKAKEKLHRCDVWSSAFFVRASQSPILQSTNIYDTVVTEATARYEKYNVAIAEAMTSKSDLVGDLRKSVGQDLGLEALMKEQSMLMRNYKSSDYLVSRAITIRFQSLAKELDGLSSKAESALKRSESLVAQQSQKSLSDIKDEEAAKRSFRETEIATALAIIAIPVATVFLGIEIIAAWKVSLIEGFLGTIVIGIVGAVLLLFGSAIFGGLLAVVSWMLGIVEKSIRDSRQSVASQIGSETLERQKDRTARIGEELASLSQDMKSAFRHLKLLY